VLVSEEKLLVLVASQTFRKGPATPVKWHRSHIIIQRLTIPGASLEREAAPSGAVSVAGAARDSGGVKPGWGRVAGHPPATLKNGNLSVVNGFLLR
jgi:hypothetical protein